ncbi:MAG: VWA domain-containing protein [Saprospiraceae bacterium]|nr:VWA domain-containing protein [Saprospiraceae bacterium]
MDESLQKWRLVLGQQAEEAGAEEKITLSAQQQGMDKVLEALYDSQRKGGLGSSSPNVSRWLGDIRRYFPAPVVQVMQKDALDRLGLQRMLLEPELLEAVTPDVHLVSALLSLSKVLPVQTQATAREVVEKVVKALEARLRYPMQVALRGRLDRAERRRRPRPGDINWLQTLRANLKHYQPTLKTVIPEQWIGYGRQANQLRDVILLIDQSGSMATSVVYAGVLSCIMASTRSLRTRVVAFDTAVVDLTEHLSDPVSLLFATQLGGGTDIHKALAYAQPFIQSPANTIMVLISDLFEGGNQEGMLRRIAAIKASGVNFICLLALNDEGAPAYDREVAESLARLDIPSFACTPDLFPDLMAAAINRQDIHQWMNAHGLGGK